MVREEYFWSKNKMYEELCAIYYQDHIVVHVGTNDLLSKKELTDIFSTIVDLALKLKSNTCQVSVSNLTTQNNQHH